MEGQNNIAGQPQGHEHGGTEESLTSSNSASHPSHQTQTPESLPSVPSLQGPASPLTLSSSSPPYRPSWAPFYCLPGPPMAQKTTDEIMSGVHVGYRYNNGPVVVGGAYSFNMDDDPLASPYPPADTTRRGDGHINDVLRQIEILKSHQHVPIQNPYVPTGKQAVPWQNDLQPPQPEQLLQGLLDQRTPRFDRMRAIRERQHPATIGLPVGSTAQDNLRSILCKLNGFSSNYKGDISNQANRSADISEDENTSLWIVGLSANMTVTHLLGCIAQLGRTGKIWATVISDAQPDKGHAGSAAKIVFFDRVGAERVKNAIEEGRLNQLVGRSIRVTFNRIRSAPQPASDSSRVLLIKGPRALVNKETLDRLFSERFVYQTEGVYILEDGASVCTLEWRFGSFRSQAQAAGMLLSREYQGIIAWAYGNDPCDME